MSEDPKKGPHSPFATLSRKDNQRLWAIVESIRDLEAERYSAHKKSELKGFEIASNPLVRIDLGKFAGGLAHDKARILELSNYLDRNYSYYSQRWETAQIDCDYLEKTIIKQTEVNKFLQEVAAKGPDKTANMLTKLFPKTWAQEISQLDSIHEILVGFSNQKFTAIYANAHQQLEGLATDLSELKSQKEKMIKGAQGFVIDSEALEQIFEANRIWDNKIKAAVEPMKNYVEQLKKISDAYISWITLPRSG